MENLDIVFIVFFSVFSIFILEWILLGFWNKICWSVGIPIFFKRFAFKGTDVILEKVEEFVKSFGDAKGFKDLTGKKVEDNVFFFRVRMDRKNSSFFHGSIRLDFENRILVLRGVLGVSDLLAFLLIVFLYINFSSGVGFFSPYLLAVLLVAVNEGGNFWKCRKMAKKIEELLTCCACPAA